MTDKEILEKVYERLKDRYHSPEQKMFGAANFIEQEWQRRDEIECGLSESDQALYLDEAKKHTPINREN